MSLKQLTAAQLGRHWEQSTTPCVLLNEQRQVHWANAALGQWLGCEVATLIGQVWPFAIGDQTWSQLAPDPVVWQGTLCTSTVQAPQTNERFQLTWLPICDESGDVTAVWGMLLAVEATDQPVTPWPATIDWHQQLQSMQEQMSVTARQLQLVGQTPARRLARQRAEWATQQQLPVWIMGPTGSGRRSLAQAIHLASLGAQAPLVQLDATVLDLEQLAARLRSWSITTSSRGSLILNNAERLSAEVAATLPRWLTANSPWRLILTSEQLPSCWAGQEYATELQAAFEALTITLPALKTIRTDLPLLIQQQIEDRNRQSQRQLRGCRNDALEQLICYDWPGELVELARVIQAAHHQATTLELTAADLPLYLSQAQAARLYPAPVTAQQDFTALLADYERTLLSQALAAAHGNKTAAATSLKMNRAKFYRRCQELGLLPSSSEPATTPTKEPVPTRRRKPTRRPPLELLSPLSDDPEAPEFIPDIPFMPADDE